MNYDYKLYLEIRKIYFMSEIYEHVRTSETDNKIVLLLKFHYTSATYFRGRNYGNGQIVTRSFLFN